MKTLLGSGGGRSKVRSGQAPKTGAANRAVSPLAVSRLGEHVGNHSMDKGNLPYHREPLFAGRAHTGAALGNDLATNVGKGSPGAGRTVYRIGCQATHGAPAQGTMPKPRDILSEYGPESKRRG
jgi:hypothetical protein